MLTGNLFDNVLINPVREQQSNRVLIVSGFATANMAQKHIEELSLFDSSFEIDLIVGMTPIHGISTAQHLGFKKISEKSTGEKIGFQCRYVTNSVPVHAKVYCWMQNENPILAFAGSANYTATGFSNSQIETMDKVEPLDALKFFKKIEKYSGNCLSSDMQKYINFVEVQKQYSVVKKDRDVVKLSLLLKNGEAPKTSGINWGQRKGRDPSQAYISIPAQVIKSDFFPERKTPFTVLTDDNYSFILVRAQDNGKALHSIPSNALLGEYLRRRIGLKPGAFVNQKNLKNYGRTDVEFTKIDEETYFMDFGVENL